MEILILSCLQLELIMGKIIKHNIPIKQKNELIWELKQITPKECIIETLK